MNNTLAKFMNRKAIILIIFLILTPALIVEYIKSNTYLAAVGDQESQASVPQISNSTSMTGTEISGTNEAIKSERTYSNKEKHDFIYSYLMNLTGISDSRYLRHLNKTLLESGILGTFDIEKFKTLNKSFPCLIHPELRIHSNRTLMGSSMPILTSSDNGRLGNKMGEYASLFAIGRLYNITTFIHSSMRRNLESIFPHLTLPHLPSEMEKSSAWESVANVPPSTVNFAPVELAAAGLLGPKTFVIDDYPFEIKLFQEFRDEIIEEFKFADEYVRKANIFLQMINSYVLRNNTQANATFVSLHVRRTDYLWHIKHFAGELPNVKYIKAALNYFRAKYSNLVFIAASDDREYLKTAVQNETDVFIVPDVDGASTMAILTSCNHSIITVGSYTFWSGYLTGGEVVFWDCNCSLPYSFSKESYAEAKLPLFHSMHI